MTYPGDGPMAAVDARPAAAAVVRTVHLLAVVERRSARLRRQCRLCVVGLVCRLVGLAAVPPAARPLVAARGVGFEVAMSRRTNPHADLARGRRHAQRAARPRRGRGNCCGAALVVDSRLERACCRRGRGRRRRWVLAVPEAQKMAVETSHPHILANFPAQKGRRPHTAHTYTHASSSKSQK